MNVIEFRFRGRRRRSSRACGRPRRRSLATNARLPKWGLSWPVSLARAHPTGW